MWYTRKLHLSLTHTNLTQSGKNTLTAAEHLSSMRRRSVHKIIHYTTLHYTTLQYTTLHNTHNSRGKMRITTLHNIHNIKVGMESQKGNGLEHLENKKQTNKQTIGEGCMQPLPINPPAQDSL